MRTDVFRSAACALAALLASCGGGEDNPPPPALPAGDITCGLANFEPEVLRLVNEQRAAGANCGTAGTFGPAVPLTWDTRLAAAAYGHSRDMADHNYFSHTSLDGRTPGDRVTAAGYAWSAVGENIAGGPATVAAVIDGWMASPGHCANIMAPRFRQIGVACAFAAASTYGRYWTMELATP